MDINSRNIAVSSSHPKRKRGGDDEQDHFFFKKRSNKKRKSEVTFAPNCPTDEERELSEQLRQLKRTYHEKKKRLEKLRTRRIGSQKPKRNPLRKMLLREMPLRGRFLCHLDPSPAEYCPIRVRGEVRYIWKPFQQFTGHLEAPSTERQIPSIPREVTENIRSFHGFFAQQPKEFKVIVLGTETNRDFIKYLNPCIPETPMPQTTYGQARARMPPTFEQFGLTFQSNLGPLKFNIWAFERYLTVHVRLPEDFAHDLDGAILVDDLASWTSLFGIESRYHQANKAFQLAGKEEPAMVICGEDARWEHLDVRGRRKMEAFAEEKGLPYCDLFSQEVDNHFEMPLLILARKLTGTENLTFLKSRYHSQERRK